MDVRGQGRLVDLVYLGCPTVVANPFSLVPIDESLRGKDDRLAEAEHRAEQKGSESAHGIANETNLLGSGLANDRLQMATDGV
jgi:hypothetical protein